jgi:hypothetical protein
VSPDETTHQIPTLAAKTNGIMSNATNINTRQTNRCVGGVAAPAAPEELLGKERVCKERVSAEGPDDIGGAGAKG